MQRTRNVRLSVRTLTEAVDPVQGSLNSSWAHTRYQRFTIWPLKPDVRRKISREGMDADWQAQGRDKPAVDDTMRLVALDSEGVQELVFTVVKSLSSGRKQMVYLKEVAEVQS